MPMINPASKATRTYHFRTGQDLPLLPSLKANPVTHIQLPPPSRTRCTIRNLSRDPCHSISRFKAATMPQLPRLNPKRARLAARIALMRRESSLKPHEGAETRDTFAVKARLALGEKSWRAIP